MSDDIESLKEAEKESLSFSDSDFSHHEIEHKPDNDHWMGGIILITIGTLFLLSTVFGFGLHNWWAIFILMPGLGKLAYAAQCYQSDGRFSSCARKNFTGGLTLILVACVFFFSWSWGAIWPVFLIIFGASALLSGLLK